MNDASLFPLKQPLPGGPLGKNASVKQNAASTEFRNFQGGLEFFLRLNFDAALEKTLRILPKIPRLCWG